MGVIRNIDQLTDILSDEAIKRLEAGAKQQKKHNNIEFEILSVNDHVITIGTEQLENSSGNYANFRMLAKRTSDLFGKHLPQSYKLEVQPVEFIVSPSAVVTPEWIGQKMLEKGIRIKQIVFETGINRNNVSDWANGKKPMSQIVKAMFYFYFR
jgi:hypothetical protein